jgi:crotonobetainyl-CoA:carnitine CoA-transferase CaiB-like acyl-CoA transferase
VTLDYKAPKGREVCLRLVAGVDVQIPLSDPGLSALDRKSAVPIACRT